MAIIGLFILLFIIVASGEAAETFGLILLGLGGLIVIGWIMSWFH